MQTQDLTLQDLTIAQFRELIKTTVREVLEETLAEMCADDESQLELNPEFVQEILERQRLRREGKTSPLSSEEAMKVLGLDD